MLFKKSFLKCTSSNYLNLVNHKHLSNSFRFLEKCKHRIFWFSEQANRKKKDNFICPPKTSSYTRNKRIIPSRHHYFLPSTTYLHFLFSFLIILNKRLKLMARKEKQKETKREEFLKRS